MAFLIELVATLHYFLLSNKIFWACFVTLLLNSSNLGKNELDLLFSSFFYLVLGVVSVFLEPKNDGHIT